MSSCHSGAPHRTGGFAKAARYIEVDSEHLALAGTSDLKPASKAVYFDPNELDIGSDGMVYFRATDISGKAYWLMVPVGEQAVCLALLRSDIDPNKKRIALRTVPGNGDGPIAFYSGDDGGTNSITETDRNFLAYLFASVSTKNAPGLDEVVPYEIEGVEYKLSDMRKPEKRTELLRKVKDSYPALYSEIAKKDHEDISNDFNSEKGETWKAAEFGTYDSYLRGKSFDSPE